MFLQVRSLATGHRRRTQGGGCLQYKERLVAGDRPQVSNGRRRVLAAWGTDGCWRCNRRWYADQSMDFDFVNILCITWRFERNNLKGKKWQDLRAAGEEKAWNTHRVFLLQRNLIILAASSCSKGKTKETLIQSPFLFLHRYHKASFCLLLHTIIPYRLKPRVRKIINWSFIRFKSIGKTPDKISTKFHLVNSSMLPPCQ